ncbi:MAG: hypothetical protein E7266_00990 [Lachnospiraceae bacterium]|nr:hypothetical protein [Lachnospiraceae bacterium]
MAGEIRINTDEVAMAATSIEEINKKLNEKLLEGQAAVKALGSTWEGEASQETVSTFDAFASKYFETYKDMIDSYVVFLREKVEQGYFKTETKNTDIASQFK